MNPSKHYILALSVAALTFAISTSANAQLLLNVQLNGGEVGSQYSGPAAIGTAGDYWNNVLVSAPATATPSSGFLLSDNSTASPVTLTLTNFTGTGVGANSSNPGVSLLRYYSYNNNLTQPGTVTVTIGNLTPGSMFNLYVYGTADHQGAGASFSVNGSATQTTYANDSYPSGAFVAGADYVSFSSVAVNGLGNLVIDISHSTEPNYSVINGFQLQAVPEPTTFAAIALGLGLLGVRKPVVRRRSQA